MTTVTAFAPSATAAPPFQFQAQLDGATYNVSVTWNVYGQRWYIGIYDLSGNLVLFRPMTGSGAKIQSVLSWADWTATAALQSPHNIPVGAVANVDVSDTGLAYDGAQQVLAVDPMTLTFPLSTDPGQSGVTGNISQDVNLVGGYFKTSTLIYRPGTGQFEVTP
jgi:hypothetical protein